MHRHVRSVALLLVLIAIPGTARAQQSVNFFLGGFNPHGADSRTFDDVLSNEQSYFLFNVGQFSGVTVGGEWLVALGRIAEASAGVGFYSNTVPSSYAALVSDTGGEIAQDLSLRIIPTTFTFRVLPMGRKGPLQPYFGAGAGVFSWKYSESGQFVDPDSFIFTDRYESSGTAVGPVILGGLRVAFGKFVVGGEVRYQSATGDLDPGQFGAVASKIDLGGFNYLATFNVRF